VVGLQVPTQRFPEYEGFKNPVTLTLDLCAANFGGPFILKCIAKVLVQPWLQLRWNESVVTQLGNIQLLELVKQKVERWKKLM